MAETGTQRAYADPTNSLRKGRYVSINEAKQECKKVGSQIIWRPIAELPESEQFAVVLA